MMKVIKYIGVVCMLSVLAGCVDDKTIDESVDIDADNKRISITARMIVVTILGSPSAVSNVFGITASTPPSGSWLFKTSLESEPTKYAPAPIISANTVEITVAL